MLVSENLGSLGLVDVEYKGQRLAVYRRDIEERADKMADS